MSSNDFTTTILVDKSADEVFNDIKNVKEWWHGKIEGKSENIGDELSYWYKDYHFSHQKVVELIPNERLTWLVTESKLPPFHDQSEWTNTRISFELKQKGNQTEIRFTHSGLNTTFECWNDCSQGWTDLIQKSLTSLIQTGKGIEVFN